MNETLIPIPGRLHSVASEGHVAGANEIYDDTREKLQSEINQGLEVPILTSAPDENTLTYDDGDKTFAIDQLCKMAVENNLYKYYRLHNVVAGKAYWQEEGSGSGESSQLNSLKVNLYALYNEGATTMKMPSNVVVTLTDNTDSSKTVTKNWDGNTGNTLLFKDLNPNHSYELSSAAVSGYTSPNSYTPTSLEIVSGTTIDLNYTAYRYHVVVESNQSDATDVANAKVSFGGTEYSNGDYIYQTSAISGVTGLSATDLLASGYAVELTNSSYEIKASYKTEVLTVNVATDQSGISAEGAVLTINGSDYIVPASGAVSAKIPSGTTYSVTAAQLMVGTDKYVVTDLSGCTDLVASGATGASRNVSLIYVLKNEEEITGYIINQSNPDAAATDMIEMTTPAMNSTDDEDVIHRIHSNAKLYAASLSLSSGKLQVREVSKTDKTKWADGTSISGTYDYFMKLPEFWWKVSEVTSGSDRWQVQFSMDEQTGSGWNHWVGNKFLGVYEAYVNSNKVYSRRGVTPTGDVTWTNYTSYARARGTGYTLIDYDMHKMLCLLGWGWLGTTDDQSVVGYGSQEYTKVTGKCDAKGMADTAAAVDGGNTPNGGSQTSINFWGLENIWGNMYEWVDNLKTADSNGNVNILATNLSSVNRTVKGNTSNGCIGKMVMGTNGDMIPSAYNSNSIANYGSGFASYGNVYGGAGNVAYRSYYYAYPDGGLGCLRVGSSPDSSHTYVGSRLLFTGDYVETSLS